MTEFLSNLAHKAAPHLILAHGAGARMTSDFMTMIAGLIAERGVSVHRFEFAYMAGRSAGGGRRPPPKMERLVEEYRQAITDLRVTLAPEVALFIGGKSLGGRVASLIAAELHARAACSGLVCLGYPFHPLGKPESLRTAHLSALACPALIVQGERDPFGSEDEVAAYQLSRSIAVTWLRDGDHDFKPRAASGTSHTAEMAKATDAVVEFVRRESAPANTQ